MPELPRVVELSSFEADVSEPYRDAYRQIDGKMRLHTSEDGPLERALEANKSKLETRDRELAELRESVDALKGELGKATGQIAGSKFSKSGDEWEAAVAAESDKRWKADRTTLEAKVEKFELEKDESAKVATEAKLEADLRAAASKTSPFLTAVATIASESRAAGFTQVDGNGVPVAIGDDGAPLRTKGGSLLTYDHFIAELRDPKGRDMGFLWPGKVGTGAHSTTVARAGRTAGGSRKDMTPLEKAELIGRDGLDAFNKALADEVAAATGARNPAN